MKAPEKVYRTTTYLNSERGNTVWKSEPVKGAENIEYVRKDAFIEKACEFLETYPHMFMGKLRSEMIEDFKEYLKK